MRLLASKLILLLVLGLGSVSCATGLHIATVADTTLVDVLHQLKIDEANAYASGTYSKAEHDKIIGFIIKADADAIAITDALSAWAKTGSAPATMPTIALTTMVGIQSIIADLTPTLGSTNPFIVDLNKALAFL